MKNSQVVFVVIAVLVISCFGVAAPDNMYDQFRTFSKIVATVNANYVTDVDQEKLFYGAYNGMLQSLDPYSMFLPPAEKEDLEVETKGEFGGLGIELTTDKDGILTVVTPIEDTPAFKAGVLAGDRIIKINGKSTKGLTITDAIKQLRGKRGTPVQITVYHENAKIEDITVVRDIIKLESVKDVKIVDDHYKIGYLRLTQFQANSVADLDVAVKKLQADGMKALIIDERFNPGGLLNTAIDICDRFLSEGTIVSTKGRASEEQVFKAHKDGTYPDFPVVILISGRSASAAEIFAGAMQDNKRALIVGTRSFGKGSVQSLFKLEDGKSALRLTIAYYYTPSGRLIHRNPNNPDQKVWGIEPDIEVKVTPQDELDLWESWRQQHLKEIHNNGNNGQKPGAKEDKPPAPSSATDPDIQDLLPSAQPDKADAATKKDFHDTTMEAAVNALKGMILAQERSAPAAAAQPK